MFTGLVQEIGNITKIRSEGNGRLIAVAAPRCATELKVNDSVSMNGVCLTVTDIYDEVFHLHAVDETLRKTTLSLLSEGDRVNLELAMTLSDRLGGHLVLGHVDGTGTIESIVKDTSSWLFTFLLPEGSTRYVIPVGSIAIDGVSLTVARLDSSRVTVAVIPHTYHHTIFHMYRVETKVNIEFDIIGKYIERLVLSEKESPAPINSDTLRRWGY